MRKRPAGGWLAVFGRLVRDREYRIILVSLFLFGLAVGLILPYVALWVTRDLGGSTWQAAFIFVPFGIVGVIVNLVASAYSDRVGRRKGAILLSLFVGGLARVALAFASNYPLAVIAYAVTGFAPFALLFALLRDTIRTKQAKGEEERGSEAFLTTLVRALFSLGWLLGPVVGAAIIGLVGFRGLFATSAGLVLATGGWAWIEMSEGRSKTEAPSSTTQRLRIDEGVVLLLLFCVGLFLAAGDSGRLAFMALYLTRSLRLPISDVSWAFSATVFSELLVMPLAGRLADRFGLARIMTVGVTAQAVYCFGMAVVSAYWMVLLLQILYAFVISTSSGLAILFAQQMIAPERTGLSTSAYLVSRGLAPLLNSLFVGIAFFAADLGRLFGVFGLLACVALLLVRLILRFDKHRAVSYG